MRRAHGLATIAAVSLPPPNISCTSLAVYFDDTHLNAEVKILSDSQS